jgi:hypothetical protein
MKIIARFSLVLAAAVAWSPMLRAATNTAPSLSCPAPGIIECSSSNGAPVTLNAIVSDPEGDALTVVWTIDGSVVQTNSLAAGSTQTTNTVQFTAEFGFGAHDVSISASDRANTVSCTSTVMVGDTTPPIILSDAVTPSLLWPPNHKYVPVSVSVVATDTCGTVTCRIKSITSNEAPLARGSGHTPEDWIITGDLTAKLRAERSGRGDGRHYTITVECTDEATNTATATLDVFVPHDKRSMDLKGKGPKGNGKGPKDPPGHARH